MLAASGRRTSGKCGGACQERDIEGSGGLHYPGTDNLPDMRIFVQNPIASLDYANRTMKNTAQSLSWGTLSTPKELPVPGQLQLHAYTYVYYVAYAVRQFIPLLIVIASFFALHVAAAEPNSRTFGVTNGLQLHITADGAAAYRVEIWDGNTLVLSRTSADSKDFFVSPASGNVIGCRQQLHHFSYDSSTRILRLWGPYLMAGGLSIMRWETYHFLSTGEIDSRIGVSANKAVSVWFSPTYTAGAGSRISWIGDGDNGASSIRGHFESPVPEAHAEKQYSPIPALGISTSHGDYVIASGSSWDHPLPWYAEPHLYVNGQLLSAPQIGTETHRVLLKAGKGQEWRTVIGRMPRSARPSRDALEYALELGGQLAMSHALLDGKDKIKYRTSASLKEQALAGIGSIALATAYWARVTTPDGSQSVTPAAHYNPGTWMRDSFWTVLGLDGLQIEQETEMKILSAYSRAIPRTGPFAGRVPLVVNTPQTISFDDESGLYFLVRMYRDVALLKIPVADPDTARLVLDYILNHQVRDGTFLAAGPSNFMGNPFSPNGWLDGYGYTRGDVIASNQGLFVVALEAARRLGLAIDPSLQMLARANYAKLYDDRLGYMRWIRSKEYRSPDVLIGEALSLYLFNLPILSDDMVRTTLKSQVWSSFGMKVLANGSGGFVAAHEFLNTTNDGHAEEPGGWYQNGGSWLLWEYLAEYAGRRHGSAQACTFMQRSMKAELDVTPLLKEFKLTNVDPQLNKVDPGGNRTLGSTDLSRQGYGWNVALRAFQQDLYKRGLSCKSVMN